MYFADHNPPHFHVLGRDGAAQVRIDTLEVIQMAGKVGRIQRRRSMSIGKLTHVRVVGPQSLSLSWDDKRSATVDLASVIAARASLGPISNPVEFARVAASDDGWSLEWPCGIDFGTAQLRRWADEQSGKIMPAKDFRHWMDRHGLSLNTAADALGLSRRTIAYYVSGEQPVPKTVMLATEGYDHRRAA